MSMTNPAQHAPHVTMTRHSFQLIHSDYSFNFQYISASRTWAWSHFLFGRDDVQNIIVFQTYPHTMA